MFQILSEQKRLFIGIVLGVLIIFLGLYLLLSLRQSFYSSEKVGFFFPIISIEFTSNSNHFLKEINRNQALGFAHLLDISVFLLFVFCSYVLLIFDFFRTEKFHLKKFIFYILLLVFVMLSLFEYFFLFHLLNSNKQEMICEFRTFSLIIQLKWIVFFLNMAVLGIVVWLEAHLYLLKLTAFFYVASFFVFLFHFKFQQLIDLSLILISLGLVGNWLYFNFRIIQLKGIKK